MLRKYLKKNFGQFTWSPDPWNFIALWKSEVIARGHVSGERRYSTDTDHREYNYQKCYWIKGKGLIHARPGEVSGVDYFKQEQGACGEKLCLKCAKKAGGKRYRKWHNKYQALFEALEDQGRPLPGFVQIDFTLPESQQAVPFDDPKVEKKLLDGIQQLIRDMYGRSRRAGKSRNKSNVPMHMVVHAAGDKDLFKNRWHCHSISIPSEIIDGQLYNLAPATDYTGNGHNPVDWKFDLARLRAAWRAVIEKALGSCPVAEPVLYVQHNPYNFKSYKWRGCTDWRADFWAKMNHAFRYDMRDFARDIEAKTVSSSMDGRLVALKAQRGDECYWYIKPIGALIERYQWIREKQKISTRGWVKYMKTHQAALDWIYTEGDLLEREGCMPPVPAEVWREIRKEYDDKLSAWRMKVYEQWRFTCPITGNEVEQRELEPYFYR